MSTSTEIDRGIKGFYCFVYHLIFLQPIVIQCGILLTSEKERSRSRCLTPWGWVTHICINKLTIIDSDNGLSPGQCQAIIWTNAQILLIEPLGTNFSEILTEIYKFSFKKMHLKMLYGKWQTSCLSLNVLDRHTISFPYGSNLECLSSVALHLEKIHNIARLVCIIC